MQQGSNMKQEDIRVRCTKCGDVHMESDRPREEKGELRDGRRTPLVCPKCGHPVWEQA